MQTFIIFLACCWTGVLVLAAAVMCCAARQKPGLREDAEVPR